MELSELWPNVTLVIVTWNAAAYIAQALDSVRAQTYPAERLTTVIVDNASHDNTLLLIRDRFPWAQIVAETANRGFAAANNHGMRRFPADLYALVNPDVRLRPDWLENMVRAMQADPQIGAAGCKLFFGDGVTLQHAGAMIRDNALTYHLGANEPDRGQYDSPRDVDYVIGAAVVLRGDAVARLGYLPEAYFMYFEETEWCMRIRGAGWRVVYVPGAVGIHDEKRSLSGRPSLKYLWRYHRSRIRFVLRNFTTPELRRRFRAAEHDWLRTSARDPRYRALILAAKLSHGPALLGNAWLL